MALGAQRGTVVWMVLRESPDARRGGSPSACLRPWGTSKFVESLLFGLEHNDPQSLAMAVAILLSASLVAGYFPARKASRIDRWSHYGTSERGLRSSKMVAP
jgi:hypothetical protein